MARYLIPLAVFVLLVGFLAAGLRLDPSHVPSPLIDKPAPEFTLPRVVEPDKTLGSADLRGRVSLLNVWASWCVACRVEHPLLVGLARAGNVTIYGLNYKDQRQDAVRWLGDLGNPYLASAHDLKGKVGIDFGVYGVPETFVVDQKGIIRYKHIGPIDEKTLKDVILPLMRELQERRA
ncbi:MAG: DsbE family thiol:disulfide interchange protein [Acidiferrobacterales bacterium]